MTATPDCILNLIVDPATEDAVTDWLLDQQDVQGFTSINAHGHGASPHSMTLAEQVTGRQRRVMFMLHLTRECAEQLLAHFGAEFPGSGAHYWLMPALGGGRVTGD